jgi:hypothetical protein
MKTGAPGGNGETPFPERFGYFGEFMGLMQVDGVPAEAPDGTQPQSISVFCRNRATISAVR